jgi:uncharacterized protein YjbI with pentapeptide repeats
MLYEEELNLTLKNVGLLSEDHVFRYIHLETNIEISVMISGIFDSCKFERIEFYWNQFNLSKFINCKFKNVKFRGARFSDCIFIKCEFESCEFAPANVGNGCSYTGNTWNSIKFINCKNPPDINPE